MKENLKPCVYDRRERNTRKRDRVLFVERSGELRLLARLSTEGAEPQGNRALTGHKVSSRKPETG